MKLYRTAHDKIVETVANGGRVLFIGTKRQAQEAVAAEAGRAGQFHVTNRWMGGTLTNFATIQKSIERLKKLEAMFADGSVNRYQKKEILTLQREMAKLELTLGVLVLGILAHGFAFEEGFGHGGDEKLNGADGVVVAGDDVVDDVGIAVGVGDGHDRDAELAAFLDGDFFTVGVDDEGELREAIHVLDAAAE